jgi:hypothetical protein
MNTGIFMKTEDCESGSSYMWLNTVFCSAHVLWGGSENWVNIFFPQKTYFIRGVVYVFMRIQYFLVCQRHRVILQQFKSKQEIHRALKWCVSLNASLASTRMRNCGFGVTVTCVKILYFILLITSVGYTSAIYFVPSANQGSVPHHRSGVRSTCYSPRTTQGCQCQEVWGINTGEAEANCTEITFMM